MTPEMTFEVFKLLVEEVREARRARRDLSNMFMTLNTAGVGALGFLARGDQPSGAGLLAWAAMALVLTCLIWRLSNQYYSGMLATKYEILYEYEKKLGIDPLQREWGGLPRRGLMRWFSFERAMPFIFILGYGVFVAFHTSPADVSGVTAAILAGVHRLLGGVL